MQQIKLDEKTEVKPPPKLTEKQAAFCREYLVDLNATQAAIRAGYAKKAAYATGAENLRKPQIQHYIKAAIEQRAEKTQITAESVLKRINEVAERCMQAEPVYDADGSPTGEYRFDSGGANKALKMLGDHLGLFIQKIEHSGSIENRFAVLSDAELKAAVKAKQKKLKGKI